MLSLPHLNPSALRQKDRVNHVGQTTAGQTNFTEVWCFYLKHTRALLHHLRSTSWRQSSRQQLSSWRWSGLMSSDVTLPWAGSSWMQLPALNARNQFQLTLFIPQIFHWQLHNTSNTDVSYYRYHIIFNLRLEMLHVSRSLMWFGHLIRILLDAFH